jgi:hypothetical protein
MKREKGLRRKGGYCTSAEINTTQQQAAVPGKNHGANIFCRIELKSEAKL